MPYILDNIMETDGLSDQQQQPENRFRPTTGDVTSRIGRALLRGHTMLASHCAECNTVMLRDPRGAEYCITCDGDAAAIHSNRSSMNNAIVSAARPPQPIQQENAIHTQSMQEAEQLLAARRLRRDRISDRISQSLLQGHAMLDRHCGVCDTVILRY